MRQSSPRPQLAIKFQNFPCPSSYFLVTWVHNKMDRNGWYLWACFPQTHPNGVWACAQQALCGVLTHTNSQAALVPRELQCLCLLESRGSGWDLEGNHTGRFFADSLQALGWAGLSWLLDESGLFKLLHVGRKTQLRWFGRLLPELDPLWSLACGPRSRQLWSHAWWFCRRGQTFPVHDKVDPPLMIHNKLIIWPSPSPEAEWFPIVSTGTQDKWFHMQGATAGVFGLAKKFGFCHNSHGKNLNELQPIQYLFSSY